MARLCQCKQNHAFRGYKSFMFLQCANERTPSFCCLFFVEVHADRECIVRIDRAFIFLDVLNDPFFIDDNVRTPRPLVRFALDVVSLEDAVVLEHFFVHVAEEGELDVDLLGERCVGRGGIHTDAENCRIVRINLTGSESSLDRLKLLRSTASKSENIDGEKDVLLAAEVRKLYGLPFVAEKGEVRSMIPDFECSLGHLLGILGMERGGDGERQRRQQQRGCNSTSHFDGASLLDRTLKL